MVTTMMEPKVCSFCSLTTTIARLASYKLIIDS